MKKVFLLVIWLFFFSSAASFAHAANDIEVAGSVLRILLPVSACAMTYGFDDKEGRHQFYKSFISTVGVTYGLKTVIDKERPDGSGDDAFPSGHSAMAFSGASFVQRRYGFKYGAWAYAGAAFVGWSRIDANQHDFTDVCAGALIGMGTTWLFTKPFKKNVSVTPIASDHKIGLAISSTW